MKYIQDVQRKPNADFAWPGILRSEKNTEAKALITLFLKLPNMNTSKVIFTFIFLHFRGSRKYPLSFKLD